MIDEGAREVTDLVLWDRIFYFLLNFDIAHAIVDITPSLQDAAHVGVDPKLVILMYPGE